MMSSRAVRRTILHGSIIHRSFGSACRPPRDSLGFRNYGPLNELFGASAMMKLPARAKNRAFAMLAAASLMVSGPVFADPLAPEAGSFELDPVVSATEPGVEADADAPQFEQFGEGRASYYGHELAGNRTASGERFDPQELTAAHRTLPMGSKLRVTNKANGKSVIVRVNDRGPFKDNRVIDVSLAAAREIAIVGAGTASVTLELMR